MGIVYKGSIHHLLSKTAIFFVFSVDFATCCSKRTLLPVQIEEAAASPLVFPVPPHEHRGTEGKANHHDDAQPRMPPPGRAEAVEESADGGRRRLWRNFGWVGEHSRDSFEYTGPAGNNGIAGHSVVPIAMVL